MYTSYPMGVFSSAPVFKKPASPKRKGRTWNIYAQQAKQRKQMRTLVDENIRLRAENEVLQRTARRLQQENDALWHEIGLHGSEKRKGE